jgi:Putative auto-transporter adhesin, head GIN domain
MVKFIVFCTKIVIATIMALLFTSCHSNFDFGNGIDGNGDVRTEKRDVEGSFTRIEASRGLNVEVEQSKSFFVEVEADDNLLEHISTKVENGTLVITTDENIDECESKTIRVKMPTITSLETTSGADITGQNTFLGANLNVKSSSGSEIDIEVEFDAVDCETTSGSSITIKGKALSLSSSSSSGSEIAAGDLMVNEITAESTSGSSSIVHPIELLRAKASSGGSIEYNHSPKTITKEESSGGSISKE